MALVCVPGALSGLAEGLAGIAATDEVNGFKFGSCELSDVMVTWYSRPVLFENLAGEGIEFALPTAYHPCPFKPDV